jgi:hypothetical protein
MDFDSRLRILVPIATGQPVLTSSSLWSDFEASQEPETVRRRHASS